jgi:hypothetical protein
LEEALDLGGRRVERRPGGPPASMKNWPAKSNAVAAPSATPTRAQVSRIGAVTSA